MHTYSYKSPNLHCIDIKDIGSSLAIVKISVFQMSCYLPLRCAPLYSKLIDRGRYECKSNGFSPFVFYVSLGAWNKTI